MAIIGNIGEIASVIEEGRRAFDNVDYGPAIPSSIKDIEWGAGDWGIEVVDPNIFVMGIHKWGSLEYKVGK